MLENLETEPNKWHIIIILTVFLEKMNEWIASQ